MTMPHAPAVLSDAEGLPDLEIRQLRSHAEYLACVELQAATWGATFREGVPATILEITQRIGGVTAGAIAPDGTLLGFVFGMTGVEHGRLVHWSDMLAVRDGMRNHGIGRRLKEFQRDILRAAGVTRMYWTYDPLVARNAHFNVNRLGATVTEYVCDMYGADTGSTLHRGLGTDRFIVTWPLEAGGGEPARLIPSPDPSLAEAMLINPEMSAVPTDGSFEPAHLTRDHPPTVRVEIPPDIFNVQCESPGRAVEWRVSTRRAFQWALARGYVVDRFVADGASRRSFYVLAAPAAPPPRGRAA
jgi:predicted GNAT superfamily acetyltransferase